MHEFSLMADLLRKIESIANESGEGKIVYIKVKLGALSHISAEHFRDHFELALQGTPADGAEIDIETLTDTEDLYAQDIFLDSIKIAT